MKVRTPLLLGLVVALPLGLGAYAASREPGPGIPTVTVTATDYALAAPDTLEAGPVRFRLLNQGQEFHHLWVVRLDQGKTVADLLEALETPGPLPAWVRDVGGPNAPVPGAESNATVSLAPGSYVLACQIPSEDGVSHVMKGMIRPLTVVPARKAPAKEPVADVTMTLQDYGFILSRPLAAGRQVIEVRNLAGQPHEIELVRLAPGRTAQEVLVWVHHPEGPPPGVPLGGVAPLARGAVSWFEAELEPGRYALICFLPDAVDGKPHFEHGMVQEIEVGAELSAR